MIDVLSLISDLKTGAAHAEVHAVHVDHAWVGLTISSIHEVCVLVLKNRHLDVYLLLASLINRLGQTKEAWVRTCCLFRDKTLVGVLVRFLYSSIVGSIDIASVFVVQ